MKLKRHWLIKKEESDGCDRYSLAKEGWKDVLEEIMWLVLIAHDMMTSQAERYWRGKGQGSCCCRHCIAGFGEDGGCY